jgi:tRNA (uracil-5-)-methyltransferase
MPLSQYQPEQYATVLEQKLALHLPRFGQFFAGEPAIYPSAPSHYRMRAEFRMWHSGDQIDFVMFKPAGTPHALTDFPIASRHISERMPRLKALLDANATLRARLFQVEFLTTTDDDTLVTLIYHRKLDKQWQLAAAQLQDDLQVQIIGRSRKQKIVLGRDYVTERLLVQGRNYSFRQTEGVFTQPNAGINGSMIEWAQQKTANSDHDLLELYCGIGNFSIPLASNFARVLATEISKQAVACARHNAQANSIDNLTLLRMSSEEFAEARNGVRPFRRLQDIDLGNFALDTLLVDPPRAGLDPDTTQLASGVPRIVYISCNPDSLLQNLAVLGHTHRVEHLAFFDQFPYTAHLECGVILQRKEPNKNDENTGATTTG